MIKTEENYKINLFNAQDTEALLRGMNIQLLHSCWDKLIPILVKVIFCLLSNIVRHFHNEK